MVTDIIAKDEQGQKYIIEMQRKEHSGILRRFFGYMCKVYIFNEKMCRRE